MKADVDLAKPVSGEIPTRVLMLRHTKP